MKFLRMPLPGCWKPSSGFPTSWKRYILGRERCSTMDHYDIFLDINQQLSNGTLQYFLEQAKCKPQNCKQNFWDYQKIFEEPYLEDESGALGYSSVMERYTLVFYMKTPEVKFFKFIKMLVMATPMWTNYFVCLKLTLFKRVG